MASLFEKAVEAARSWKPLHNAERAKPATLGTSLRRVDGVLKVTGAAQYAAEFDAPGLVYGFVVGSSIATGRIIEIDASAALALPGVLSVLTHQNRPELPLQDSAYKDQVAPGGMPFRPLWDDRIWYSGQPVALVVAQTIELARHAASLVRVRYEPTAHETQFDRVTQHAYPPSTEKGGFEPPPEPRGDADAGFEQAEVRIDAEYCVPQAFHNPMELQGCTVVPAEDGALTVYEKTQGVLNTRQYLMNVFGLEEAKVNVVSPFVGGAFGNALRPHYYLPLAVMAARDLKRPVRVTLTRQQMFTLVHRPRSIQRVRLGASRDGRLQAVIHEAVQSVSQYEDYCDVVVNWSGQLYRCDNVRLAFNVAKLDTPTPGDMRAPGASQGMFALESAIDELAYVLRIDPLEFRLINYAERDANKDLPFSSKALRECFAEGARRFGWKQRRVEPRSRKEGREYIGWGLATGAWDAMQGPASAKLILREDGSLEISSATSDIGTGTYTVMTQIASATLGVPVDRIRFRLGDATLPKAPLEGGSWTVTSVGSAVQKVCLDAREQLVAMLRRHGGDGFRQVDASELRLQGSRIDMPRGAADNIDLADLFNRAGIEQLECLATNTPSERQKQYSMGTHSAVFAEVRVDESLGTVRVTRVVSAVAAGRILNPKTAGSQIKGAVVMGIGMALHEHAQYDHTLGRLMNHNFADYHVPVNADIDQIDVIFVDEHDDVVSELGAKGVAEIGIVGVAAAVANAIFHATGVRVRDLPITPDKVFVELPDRMQRVAQPAQGLRNVKSDHESQRS
jgi:xanthine dehydrogenase YagR molybdenum-binding subunit